MSTQASKEIKIITLVELGFSDMSPRSGLPEPGLSEPYNCPRGTILVVTSGNGLTYGPGLTFAKDRLGYIWRLWSFEFRILSPLELLALQAEEDE